jgi:hypothetical protein
MDSFYQTKDTAVWSTRPSESFLAIASVVEDTTWTHYTTSSLFMPNYPKGEVPTSLPARTILHSHPRLKLYGLVVDADKIKGACGSLRKELSSHRRAL